MDGTVVAAAYEDDSPTDESLRIAIAADRPPTRTVHDVIWHGQVGELRATLDATAERAAVRHPGRPPGCSALRIRHPESRTQIMRGLVGHLTVHGYRIHAQCRSAGSAAPRRRSNARSRSEFFAQTGLPH
ncbi:hypothetical protein ACFPH6_35180 [Streptomyces xiangluensis]|uniref:Uncharacterized protein n=1 Tax=Streptomyces xiangluensis TaxID=2665720 RepID=A0ABV8YZX5_9ACTN